MIKMVAAQYFESLITAVEFLHDYSVAHLDLRIENLCVSGTMDNFYVVIIDLDRSDVSATSARQVKSKYQASRMYNLTWTAENLDWMQVGIILERVFGEVIECIFHSLMTVGNNLNH